MSIALGRSMISAEPWICTNFEPLYCSPKMSMDTRVAAELLHFVRSAARRDDHSALSVDARGHQCHLRPVVLLPDRDTGAVIFPQEILRISDFHGVSFDSIRG